MNRRGLLGSVAAMFDGLFCGAKSRGAVVAPLNHPVEQPTQLWTKAGPVEVYVGSPMERLTQQIKDDPEYAWSWHCNLAVCAMDEGLDHAAANRAAARFMQTTFGVVATEPVLGPTWPCSPLAPTIGELTALNILVAAYLNGN